MKIGLFVVVFVSLILVTLGQTEDKTNGKEEQIASRLRRGLTDMKAVFQNQLMPVVSEQSSKLMSIIDSHKKPIQENLYNMKERVSEHMMHAGYEVLEKSLDLAEVLQNMTSRIKSEVWDQKKTRK